jgi:anti-sigma factor RsiW
MSACEEQLPLIGAYHDGELDAAGVARVEAHLRQCPACAAELAALRDASQRLRAYAFTDITDRELADIHRAVDEAGAAEDDDDRQVWRIGGTMGLIAASVLIVGVAWLRVIPVATTQPGGSGQPVASAPAPWERMALTLRPGPLDVVPEKSDPQTIQLAVSDWHVQGLTP